jgi:hypothetical protein
MNLEETYNFIKNKYNLLEETDGKDVLCLNFKNVTVLYLNKVFNEIFIAESIFYATRL